MPSANDLAPLDELPLTTGELARATVQAGRNVVSASAAALYAEPRRPAGLLAIRRTVLQLHFFLARSGEEIFFFFFKKQLPSSRPLEARLQISMQAVQDLPSAETSPSPVVAPPAAALVTAESCNYRLLCPPFLKVRPTPEELLHYAASGTT